MAFIKIYSGSEIFAMALKAELEAAGMQVLIKNNLESARLGGFGNSSLAVELFVDEENYTEARPIVDNFKLRDK